MVQQKPALRDFQPLTLNSLFLFSREFKKFNNTNKFYNHEIKITLRSSQSTRADHTRDSANQSDGLRQP